MRHALALLLALAAPALGAEPRAIIRGPKTGAVGERLHYELDGSASDAPLRVSLSVDAEEGSDAETLKLWYDKAGKPGLAIVVPPAPGSYLLIVTARGTPEGQAEAQEVTAHRLVMVGQQPTPPSPPGPVPPTPPGPTPPSPVPIPGTGLRVLVVYESADVSKLPPGQVAVLYSKTLRDLLNAKCPAGPDGKTREWRIYDADVDLTGESDAWKAAMARPRKSLPWIVISNGTSGYEGPLPASVDEAVKLVQAYAGAGRG